MAGHVKLAVVSGGLSGCAIALRVSRNGLANDNQIPIPSGNVARLIKRLPKDQGEWPEGLALHTAVLLDVARGKTLVKVTYPA